MDRKSLRLKCSSENVLVRPRVKTAHWRSPMEGRNSLAPCPHCARSLMGKHAIFGSEGAAAGGRWLMTVLAAGSLEGKYE